MMRIFGTKFQKNSASNKASFRSKPRIPMNLMINTKTILVKEKRGKKEPKSQNPNRIRTSRQTKWH
jgi:hypothetical protein